MLNNCLSYNERDTIFYRAGINMGAGGSILSVCLPFNERAPFSIFYSPGMKMRDAGGSILTSQICGGEGRGRGNFTFMVSKCLLCLSYITMSGTPFSTGRVLGCGTRADPFSDLEGGGGGGQKERET